EFEGELRALGIPAEAVSFEQFEKPAEFGLQDILALRQRVRPLRGGTQISLGTTGFCTLGVPARLGGTVGFLTNSHCTATTGAFDGAAQHQPNAPAPGDNSNRVGVELADSMFFTGSPCPNGLLCGNADAAFIALDAGITAYPGTIMTAGQNVRIQGETATSVVGQSLHKVGRTTGHTWGDVDCTCADVTTQGGQHVFCQDRVDDAGSNGGDSGSAVWRWASVTHRTATFHGLLWAGPAGGGDYFWFSPTNRIEAQLGNIDPTDANEPPQVAITSPQHTAVVGSGNIVPVQLVASFFDLEDGLECTLCEVRWTSDVDGYLGTSSVVNGVATLDTSLFWSGPRWIFAEAKDNNGHKSTDSILIETGNSAPSVAILRPTLTPVETVNVGSGYVLEGTSFDAELFTPLDCGSLEWTSSAFAAPSLSGCMVPTVFDTVGVHQVELTGTDPFGETDSVIHSVQVVPGPGSGPPDVSIVSPLGPGIDLHSFSMLQAYGNDPDDQSPILYEWVVRAPSHTFVSGIPPADILSNQGGVMEVRIRNTSGSDEANSQPSLWLPSSTFLSPSCSTLQFELEVRATDAQNLTTPSLPRSFSVPGPPC
nr:hypothetical protein [Myxococcota bacterium]